MIEVIKTKKTADLMIRTSLNNKVDLVVVGEIVDKQPMPLAILGYARKADSADVAGGRALTVACLLGQRGRGVKLLDPLVQRWKPKNRLPDNVDKAHVFLIGINHAVIKEIKFPVGSIVIDPWSCFEKQEGVRFVSV